MTVISQYSQKEVEEINRRLDIVKLAENYGLELTPVTIDRYKAHCVFHQEDTPSLFFYQDNDDNIDSYHCFGCGETGTGIWFIKNYEKVSFTLAVEKAKHITGYATKTFNNNIEEIVYLLNNANNSIVTRRNKNVFFFYLGVMFRDFLKENNNQKVKEWVDEQFAEIDSFFEEENSLEEVEYFFNKKLKTLQEVKHE
jgi:hypothetical protein